MSLARYVTPLDVDDDGHPPPGDRQPPGECHKYGRKAADDVELTSRAGEGTRAHVRLPVTQ